MGPLRKVWLCGCLLILAAGCSRLGATGSTANSAAVMPTNAANVCQRLQGIRPTADYDPADSPRKLGERSDLVVEGTMEKVAKGRIFHPSDPVSGRTVVMVVRVEKVHKGALPPGSARRIYIESQPHGNLPAAHFDRLLPRGAGALFFLLPYPLGGTPDRFDPEIEDKLGGRPWGQPLWQDTTPQGRLLEFDADGVVMVNECKRYPEAKLADFYPDREAFPAEAPTGDPHDPAAGKRLTERRTAHGGNTIFDPPANVRAYRSEPEALAVIRSEGVSGHLLDEPYSRESFFALYTEKGHGQEGPDGEIMLTYVRVPVWVVVVHDVPRTAKRLPSFDSGDSSTTTSAAGPSGPMDVTLILEDATGRMLATSTEGSQARGNVSAAD